MPSGAEQASRTPHDAPIVAETTITDLPVSGVLPAALSGHYMQIGPNGIHVESSRHRAAGEGMVQAVSLEGGRAIAYRNRWITTDAVARKLAIEPAPGPSAVGDDIVGAHLVAFGSSILAFGDGALAYELNARLDTIRRVDLAGARRGVVAHSKVDPDTGELHLLTFAPAPNQLHVTVSRGALKRTLRSIGDAPNTIRQLELTRDDVVLGADGFIGVTPRAGDTGAIWFATDTKARRIEGACADGDNVVVYVTGPSLDRWTLDRRAAAIYCEVLDPMAQAGAAGDRRRLGGAQHFLWTVSAGAAHKHDLFTGRRRSHDFGTGRDPGELVFVADPDRTRNEDGGWLVGFVRDRATNQSEFVVLDAEAIERPAVATVLIPRRIPRGAHGAWIPSAR